MVMSATSMVKLTEMIGVYMMPSWIWASDRMWKTIANYEETFGEKCDNYVAISTVNKIDDKVGTTVKQKALQSLNHNLSSLSLF